MHESRVWLGVGGAVVLCLAACGAYQGDPKASVPSSGVEPGVTDGGVGASSDGAAAPPSEVVSSVPPSGLIMGANVYAGGVEFRVWAPHARSVAVVGEAAGPDGRSDLASEGGGRFSARVDGARPGQKYRLSIVTDEGQTLERIDPRARAVSGNDAVVVDPRAFAWNDGTFASPRREATVIYELHVGSFYASPGQAAGTFASVTSKLDGLAELGVNAIELMPVNVYGTSHGWGYNPRVYFAPHEAYGTPEDLRRLVDAAHQRGIAVILDIVYNHYDKGDDAPLRCFDGHCPDGTAGIYFFETETYRSTPWGPRFNFAGKEVSDFLADNVWSWMREFHVDGFRHDSVSNVRAIDGQGTVPGGSELLRRTNDVAASATRPILRIAEDLKGVASITAPSTSGGLGFDAQWDGQFFGAVTDAVTAPRDDNRNLGAVRDALLAGYNGDPFQRVLFVESHDTAGNDGQRLPVRIDGQSPSSWAARKRAMLAAGLLFTTPGVPMLFQGQEWLEPGKFEPHPGPLDWSKADAPARAFYRDMIRLRRNLDGVSAGLLGSHIAVTHLNETAGGKVIAFRRWDRGGDDVVVVANLGGRRYPHYDVGLPAGGTWVARVDGDDVRYGSDFGAASRTSVAVAAQPRDGQPFTGSLALGAYSVVVLTH